MLPGRSVALREDGEIVERRIPTDRERFTLSLPSPGLGSFGVSPPGTFSSIGALLDSPMAGGSGGSVARNGPYAPPSHNKAGGTVMHWIGSSVSAALMLSRFFSGTERMQFYGPNESATIDLRTSPGWQSVRRLYASDVAKNGNVLFHGTYLVQGIGTVGNMLAHPAAWAVGSWTADIIADS